MSRRGFLAGVGAAAGLHWLTPLGEALALAAESSAAKAKGGPARSVILLWLAGGPSQLETFDPHPGTRIAAGSTAIATAAKGVKLGAGLERLAAHMGDVSLIRSITSKEGDHERGQYQMKTGWRPDPTVVHPSIGAVCCHQLPAGGTDIPRHVSIVPNQWPARGGYLGGEFDAFKTFDPKDPVPDVTSRVGAERDAVRVRDLSVVDSAFARGRGSRTGSAAREAVTRGARAMMTSDQLKAFDVNQEPAEVLAAYGDTAFGRGCLAARRLIEVGVRCVEVTLDGWDTHAENHALTAARVAELDPAFSALVADLKRRGLLDGTVVLCGGEFGRTPQVNRLGGRDHWPHNFAWAIAGGSIRGGRALGDTDPEGGEKPPKDAVGVAEVHATVLSALGIDPAKELMTPVGRPLKLSEGTPIKALLGSQNAEG